MPAAPNLLQISEAAAMLGVPAASLRAAAEQHGFIVRMGRAVRIDFDRIGELIAKCQDQPKAPASTDTNTAPNGTSQIPASDHSQRAAQGRQLATVCSRFKPLIYRVLFTFRAFRFG